MEICVLDCLLLGARYIVLNSYTALRIKIGHSIIGFLYLAEFIALPQNARLLGSREIVYVTIDFLVLAPKGDHGPNAGEHLLRDGTGLHNHR